MSNSTSHNGSIRYISMKINLGQIVIAVLLGALVTMVGFGGRVMYGEVKGVRDEVKVIRSELTDVRIKVGTLPNMDKVHHIDTLMAEIRAELHAHVNHAHGLD